MANNDFFQSKIFRILVIIILSLIALLLVFKIGLLVGVRKGEFSKGWTENYERNFAGPGNGMMRDFINDKNFLEPHGTFGQIIKIDGTTLVIKDGDNVEKIVNLSEQTIINSLRQTIKSTDLKVDDNVVIIGEPNSSGQIDAKLIRVMPPLPDGQMMPRPESRRIINYR